MVLYQICVFGADLKSNMAARVHNVFSLAEILTSCQKPLSQLNCDFAGMIIGWSCTKRCESRFADRKFKMAAMTRLSLTLDPLGGPVWEFHIFIFFFLKPQNRFESNLAEMFIGWSYTRFLFLALIGNPTWLPGPIMCSDWSKFKKSSC